MQKLLTIIFILCTGSVFKAAFAQQEPQTDTTQVTTPPPAQKEKKPFWDNIYLGGNFGLQFGDVTIVDVSPSVAYRVTDKFYPGIGATYIYFREKYYNPYTNQNDQYSTNIYGGRAFLKYFLFENIFAYSELEVINRDWINDITYKLERKNVVSPFLGGGYQQEIGENSGLFILVLFNLNDTPSSPYSNPVIRIGFSAGL